MTSNSPLHCAYAFKGLCIEASGRYKPCCKFKGWLSKFDLRKDNLIKVMNSEELVNLRKKFELGERPPECQRCWDDELNDIPSLRQSINKQFPELIEDKTVTPDLLDFGFGNKCNAACVMCESSSSSLWSEDDFELSKIENNRLDRTSFSNYENDYNWPEFELKKIKHITFGQNEVLASPLFLTFLKRLDESTDLSEKSIHLSTNGTIRPSLEMIRLFKKLKSFSVQLSIDGVGQINDYIRFPLKWTNVESGAKNWINLCNENYFPLQLRCTVSIMNIMHLDELVMWWKSVSKAKRLTFGTCWYPHYLSASLYRNELSNLISSETKKNKIIQKILKTEFDSNLERENLRIFINSLDKRRGTDFKKVFKVESSLLGLEK